MLPPAHFSDWRACTTVPPQLKTAAVDSTETVVNSQLSDTRSRVAKRQLSVVFRVWNVIQMCGNPLPSY